MFIQQVTNTLKNRAVRNTANVCHIGDITEYMHVIAHTQLLTLSLSFILPIVVIPSFIQHAYT